MVKLAVFLVQYRGLLRELKIMFRTVEVMYFSKYTTVSKEKFARYCCSYSEIVSVWLYVGRFEVNLRSGIRGQATPQFERQSQAQVIAHNLTHPVVSAYFAEYRELQKLCLAILRHEALGIGGEHDQLYGVIFDVAWLWENYVAALLGDVYQHPDNRQHLGMVPIFQGDDGLPGEMSVLFPDFYSPARRQVADTKYKFGVNGIQREDLFQLITYAHVLKAKRTGIIYPDLAQTTQFKLGELTGFGGVVYKQSLQVPQAAKSYGQFVNAMLAEESQLKTEMIAR